MNVPFFQVNAFTGPRLRGNPAAVCLLKEWPDDQRLLEIAAENNLSETAFYIESEDCFKLRWFSPKAEVDLCGHATLAAAFIILHYQNPSLPKVTFETKSGLLTVQRDGSRLCMDFPARKAHLCAAPKDLIRGLKSAPREVLLSRDYMAVYDSEEEIKTISPDFDCLMNLDCTGVIITAPGTDADFVSRFFAPRFGISEDPVTGSAHCTLIPYWSKRLGKKELHAFQLSKRGGELYCKNRGKRVIIAGKAALHMKGTITV